MSSSRGSRTNSSRRSTRPFASNSAAQVAVCEHSGRRRVASALEAIELERGERIDRRDLVDHENRRAGPRDPRKLRHDQLGPPGVVQRAQRSYDVELERIERQVLGVTDHNLDVAGSTDTGTLDHLGIAVERDHLAHSWRKRVRKCARAGPDIERTLVTTQRQKAREALRKRGRTRSLQLGETVSLAHAPPAARESERR